MPYGYVTKQPNQIVNNSGVFSTDDVLTLIDNGTLGGSLELIEILEPSGVNSIDTSVLPTEYDVIKVDWISTVSTGAANVFHARYYESGVLNTSGIYEYAISYNLSQARSNTATSVYLGNNGTNRTNGYAYFYDLSNANEYSYYSFHSWDNGGVYYWGGGSFPSASLVDKIQFKQSNAAQTFSSGTKIKIYGLKQL